PINRRYSLNFKKLENLTIFELLKTPSALPTATRTGT
ncbi:MAG: hypothetical protein ACI9JY_001399, partial [Saprospiraceae bacterium]